MTARMKCSFSHDKLGLDPTSKTQEGSSLVSESFNISSFHCEQ